MSPSSTTLHKQFPPVTQLYQRKLVSYSRSPWNINSSGWLLRRKEKIYFSTRAPVISFLHVFCLTSHMSRFTSIINTSSRPIRFCCSLTISPDLLHFLLQTGNSGEQRCFPSGPTSFRATYLPVSECQTFSVYKTQAIYFVQIRVSSLFTHCLCFYFWSFIFLTYTHSLLSDGAICIAVKVHTGTRILYNGLKKKNNLDLTFALVTVIFGFFFRGWEELYAVFGVCLCVLIAESTFKRTTGLHLLYKLKPICPRYMGPRCEGCQS